MTSFNMLSNLIRALFALWSLILCAAGIVGMVYAAFQKKYDFSLLALLNLLSAYILWQIIIDIAANLDAGIPGTLHIMPGSLPWIIWLLTFVLLTVYAVIILVSIRSYTEVRITPMSIKHCTDQMPCGICYWRSNGRVIFSNICMNQLCIALTGQPLQNGNILFEAVPEGVVTIYGRTWHFICWDFYFEGERLQEMIASDITEEYEKTKALETEMAELSRLNRELQTYYKNIDDTIRKQEILQAKINIHDEMNRLMLSTLAAEGENVEMLDHIFSLWEENTMLLDLEAEGEESGTANRLEQLAQALNISLVWKSHLPESLNTVQRELFFTAAQEAMANAAKHAGAKTLEISFSERGSALCCCFENDGRIPPHTIHFAGGLANLAHLAKEQGAAIFVKQDENFQLTLYFNASSS